MSSNCVIIFAFYLVTLNQAIPDGYIRHERGCSWSRAKGYKPKEHIITSLPYIDPIIPTAQLPTNFSWDDQNGISLVTSVRNQGLPYNCGSCWVCFIHPKVHIPH